jgi:hypothetical protein
MKLVLCTLPRWAFAPIGIASVLLGYIVSTDTYSWIIILPIICAMFGMAWAHTMNTYLDYHWTGLDKGGEGQSHAKPYSSGSQVIAREENGSSGIGTVSKIVAITGIVYLTLSGATLIALAFIVDLPIWSTIPWVVLVGATFWYSWGKLHYQCEIALGVGFGPAAALLGAAITPDPDIVKVILTSMPILLIFGFVAEIYDQWYDADANLDRGLKNIGAWVYKMQYSLTHIIVWSIVIVIATHTLLVSYNYLDSFTFIACIVLIFSIPFLPAAERKESKSIIVLLFSCSLYVILLPILEVVSRYV